MRRTIETPKQDVAQPSGGTALFIAPEPFYEDRGTPIAVREVLVALSELGWEVDLLTYPVGSEVDLPGLRTFRLANPFGFQRVPIGFSARKVLFDISLIGAIADRLRRRRYDCIHAVEESAFPAVSIAKRHGVPVLYDMQSHLPESMAKNWIFRVPPVRAVLNACQKWLVRRADVIACSAGLESYVRSVDAEASVAAWHYPAMHLQSNAQEAAALREKLGIAPERPVILYTGNFATYQGIPRLIEAVPSVVAEVPNALFLLVGGTDEEGLPASAKKLREQGHLRTLPRQPRDRMGAFLELAQVVVSPREAVGNLPLKVFDYMAAGRPIVATDSPTHRAVLDEHNSILVPPTGEAMGDAIVRLLQDHDLADSLGRKAREFAEQNLGWRAFKERLAALYATVAPARTTDGR